MTINLTWVQIILIILKTAHVITWSWWVVMLPMIFGCAIALVLFLVTLFIGWAVLRS
jgi:hypothetical protein